MFDILFGWRKASKCKKLLIRVQCRLKLLMNKRSTIVRQVRQDVAQLLGFGHEQIAFNRVEQIIKDESILTVYDLLDSYCEIIIINLRYIRKHRDCPNDINEAVSTLIYASARCGELPELRVLRNLFGERYGQRFTMTALELLHGNLVNVTIQENLSVRSVSNSAKHRLVDEIASSLEKEPLALEYTSDWQEQIISPSDQNHSLQQNKNDIVQENHFSGNHIRSKESHMDEEKIVSDKYSPEGYKSPLGPNQSIYGRSEERGTSEESSSESLFYRKPNEIVYLDDIEEFKFPVTRDSSNFQDQRLFIFKSSTVSGRKKLKVHPDGEFIELYGSMNNKIDGNRLKKRVLYWKNRNVNDVECAIYYGISPNEDCKSYEKREVLKKVPRKDCKKSFGTLAHPFGKAVSGCNLEKPCCVCVSNKEDDSGIPAFTTKRRIATLGQSQNEINYYQSSQETELMFVPQIMHEEKTHPDKSRSELKQEAEKVLHLTIEETRHPYMRAITMPLQRPKVNKSDSITRCSSFPFQQASERWSNESCLSPHVHPKLPDYDELAQQFMALKKAALQKAAPGEAAVTLVD